jgi:hypothetical protein
LQSNVKITILVLKVGQVSESIFARGEIIYDAQLKIFAKESAATALVVIGSFVRANVTTFHAET